jgi:hypothetical protein
MADSGVVMMGSQMVSDLVEGQSVSIRVFGNELVSISEGMARSREM